MEKFPIETAPRDDGWILAFDPKLDSRHRATAPWIIATRCDDGWRDEDGYLIEPTHWVPMPDPQPAPSGWRKAEGTIAITKGALPAPGTLAEEVDVWVVSVMMPDGEPDHDRDFDMLPSFPAARASAQDMSKKLGLPIASNVVPFKALKPPAE